MHTHIKDRAHEHHTSSHTQNGILTGALEFIHHYKILPQGWRLHFSLRQETGSTYWVILMQ